MKVIYRETLGGQSKGVWLYFRFWTHTFYIGEADAYPDGKYRIELLAKSWRKSQFWIPHITFFSASKYKKATKEEIDKRLAPGYEFDPITEKIVRKA